MTALTASALAVWCATMGQAPAVDVSVQASYRSGPPGGYADNNRLVPVGPAATAEAGVTLLDGFSLVASLSLGHWLGGDELPLYVFDGFSIVSATSVRVGPTARLELPLGRSTVLLQAGPRYHLSIIQLTGGLAGGSHTDMLHSGTVDAAAAWLYPAGSFLVGFRLDGSVGPEFQSVGAGLTLAWRGRARGKDDAVPSP